MAAAVGQETLQLLRVRVDAFVADHHAQLATKLDNLATVRAGGALPRSFNLTLRTLFVSHLVLMHQIDFSVPSLLSLSFSHITQQQMQLSIISRTSRMSLGTTLTKTSCRARCTSAFT